MHAQERSALCEAMLAQCTRSWGRQVLHLFDSGYTSGPWVQRFVSAGIQFIVRWRNDYKLQDETRRRKPGEMCRGRRSVAHRTPWDARKRCLCRTGLLYLPVCHPHLPAVPLWLVVARPKERPALHFLTNPPMASQEEAWTVIYAYRRRWQVETAFRHLKAELAIESPRLWSWPVPLVARLKLFSLVALLYAFLLSLLAPAHEPLKRYLLHDWCHRTGERLRRMTLPLYRLRSMIGRLWLAHPVALVPLWLNTR